MVPFCALILSCILEKSLPPVAAATCVWGRDMLRTGPLNGGALRVTTIQASRILERLAAHYMAHSTVPRVLCWIRAPCLAERTKYASMLPGFWVGTQ